MKIIDLTPEHEPIYFCCLEDWSDEMKEAGNHKEIWFNKMKDKGIRVKLALDDAGVVGGMIQYLPIEHSPMSKGEKLYQILCIWVHGYKQGRGNFRRQGMGRALLAAAEEDVKQLGANGIAAWGLSLPFWMKASWFRKKGYQKADKNGVTKLMWKPFTESAVAPKLIKRKKKPFKKEGQVDVTVFKNGWCPAMNLTYERAKRAVEELGSGVIFNEIDTSDTQILEEWGITDALYIDGKSVRNGPPPKYEKIKRKIANKV